MKDGSILRRCAGPFGHAPLIFFIVFLHRNGRGHERIDKFSARVVHWPEILSTTPVLTLSAVYTGLTRFQTLSPPRPPPPSSPTSFNIRARTNTRASTWQSATINLATDVCAARSARILDNDGAQYIAKHAWRAQQSWLEIVQIRNDHRPGRWGKKNVHSTTFPFARFRSKDKIVKYVFIFFSSVPCVRLFRCWITLSTILICRKRTRGRQTG